MTTNDAKKCAICERIEKALINSPYNNNVENLMVIIENSIFNKEVKDMSEKDLQKDVESEYKGSIAKDERTRIFTVLDALIKSVDSLATKVDGFEKLSKDFDALKEQVAKINIVEREPPVAPQTEAAPAPNPSTGQVDPEKEKEMGEPGDDVGGKPEDKPESKKPEKDDEDEEKKKGKKPVEKAEDVKEDEKKTEPEGDKEKIEKAMKVGEIKGFQKALEQSAVETPRPGATVEPERTPENPLQKLDKLPAKDLSKMSWKEINRILENAPIE